MKGAKDKNKQRIANGSSRNLDGHRISTVENAKLIAEYNAKLSTVDVLKKQRRREKVAKRLNALKREEDERFDALMKKSEWQVEWENAAAERRERADRRFELMEQYARKEIDLETWQRESAKWEEPEDAKPQAPKPPPKPVVARAPPALDPYQQQLEDELAEFMSSSEGSGEEEEEESEDDEEDGDGIDEDGDDNDLEDEADEQDNKEG